MLLKKWLALGLVAIVMLFNSGCAINRATATLDPTANLREVKTMYVTRFPSDDRGVNLLISDRLKSMGYDVDTGVDTPMNVDVVVTYKDRWMWDITMYMLELTVVIRDPKTNFPLASGNSFHTSLTRKPPNEMVAEVINNIFKQGVESEQK